MHFLPKFDPKRRNYQRFSKYYTGLCTVMMFFLNFLLLIILSETMAPGQIPVGRLISVMVGLLLLLIGNFLPKIKPNFFAGIRTPWTLSDPEVWNRTHRFGGWLFFLLGLCVALSGLFFPEIFTFCLLMAGIILVCTAIMIYSYRVYQGRNHSGPDHVKASEPNIQIEFTRDD